MQFCCRLSFVKLLFTINRESGRHTSLRTVAPEMKAKRRYDNVVIKIASNVPKGMAF